MAQKPGPFKTKVKEIILLSHRFLTCQFSNGYNETGVGIMDNFQLMDMQLSSARCSLHDVDLGRSDQTDRTCAPYLWRCAFIHPASCRWMHSCCWWPDHARQLGRGHATSLSALTWLGKTRLLGSARPTGQNYFPSCCFLLIINSTGPIGNLSFRVTPSAFR